MRVSYEWLKTLVDLPQDPKDLEREFVRTGTEVEAVERVGANLDHVVTAQVVSKEPHPDSDHMYVTLVDVGNNNVDKDGNPFLYRLFAALKTLIRETTLLPQ